MIEKFNLNRVVNELSKDNESSLEELFNYYYPRLFNFSKSFLKIEDGIDDILQEVFVKIWQNRKSIKNSATFNSYIFTITRNLLLNELRSRLNNKNIKEEVRKLSIASEYSLLEKIEYQDLKEKVDNIVNELPNRQKEIFKLSRTEGLSHKEIAEKLKISTKTVEYHITLAVRLLRDKLKSLGLVSILYFYLFF
ncbi:MAG: RNA polymerase sigma-70 factor [Draconibacterium sp.]|nr:RNA polymerase sigma-70 factor [Draconibacterium sp.]